MTRRRGVGNGRTEVVDVGWDVQSTMYKHGQGGLSAVNLGQVRTLHQVPDPNPNQGLGQPNDTSAIVHQSIQRPKPTPRAGFYRQTTKCLSKHCPSTSSSTSPQRTVRAIRLLMPTHLSREQHHASHNEIPPKYNKTSPPPRSYPNPKKHPNQKENPKANIKIK